MAVSICAVAGACQTTIAGVGLIRQEWLEHVVPQEDISVAHLGGVGDDRFDWMRLLLEPCSPGHRPLDCVDVPLVVFPVRPWILRVGFSGHQAHTVPATWRSDVPAKTGMQ